MKRSRIISRCATVLFVAAWVLPFVRAVRFLQDSRAYLQETGSADAGQDVDYSLSLLYSYTLSLAAALGVGACLAGRRTPLILIVPAGAILYAVAEVLWLHPESPITLIPLMHPWRPACISIVALTLAVVIRFTEQKPGKRRRLENAW